MNAAGFDHQAWNFPDVPVMLYEPPSCSQKMAEKLLEKGIYVIGFYTSGCQKDKRESGSSGSQQDMIELISIKQIAAFIDRERT